ncbi:MAG TPA: hypothetical protein VF316_10000 [Polyangiaceae bacterium]
MSVLPETAAVNACVVQVKTFAVAGLTATVTAAVVSVELQAGRASKTRAMKVMAHRDAPWSNAEPSTLRDMDERVFIVVPFNGEESPREGLT